ncbi:putative ATP-grasp superfamily ATP-dependent carboligase [Anaerobacterium chartisolvens]|uniref:Putative ATP-grasp superfamily ATP-dependent carboligase n=1 Tax=Anaerobacterium chartisolvens TaxID=1297424 RepID=A0A369ATQ2_9FIRM|nr:ATP-grasp domain-containing protein [Anaerobacterium chartisolvens]RCX12383.1 putative ATP-grasp superfamily ATP-dependent carboligase [Anaerobacterium chartisolvens]
MNRALITDVHYRMSLAVIRSLGRRKIPVTAVEYENIPVKSALGFYSKYTSQRKLIPCASSDRDTFISSVLELSKQAAQDSGSLPVLIPVGLGSLMAISLNRELLKPHTHFIVPPHESIETANDTGRLIKLADSIGIPCPSTTTLLENESIESLSLRISYPAVIKYREGELLKLGPEKRYRIVKSPSDFAAEFAFMHAQQPYPIVQSYVKGSGYGVSAVFDNNGEPLEIFCHRRIREYPVTGGPSCLCESIWNDRLADYAVRLLKALNWRGVAMVEFKGDLQGEICLMEINPRFWGSLSLSVAAGCDIPFAVYRAALGETAPSPSYGWNEGRYRLNIKMRFILQDLLSLRGYLKASRNKPEFLLEYIKDLLNPFICDGVIDLRDLSPSLRYLLQAFKKHIG